jgi:hypothetical protein
VDLIIRENYTSFDARELRRIKECSLTLLLLPKLGTITVNAMMHGDFLQ